MTCLYLFRSIRIRADHHMFLHFIIISNNLKSETILYQFSDRYSDRSWKIKKMVLHILSLIHTDLVSLEFKQILSKRIFKSFFVYILRKILPGPKLNPMLRSLAIRELLRVWGSKASFSKIKHQTYCLKWLWDAFSGRTSHP